MSRSDRFLALGVAGVALVRGWSGLTSGYEGPYDEGNTLCAAWRVLGGETPYRDFWMMHPPGTTWLLATAFRAFGTTLGVERGVKLAVATLVAVIIFLLARRVARPGWALGAALVFVFLPTQTLSLRSRDMGLALVLATLAVACAPSDRHRWRALVAGLLAGTTFWFKQDFLVAAAASGAVAVVLAALRGVPPGRALRTILHEALGPFAAGLGVVPLASLAALFAKGALGDFFDQAIVFPGVSFGLVRGVPLTLRFHQLAYVARSGAPAAEILDALAVPALFLVAAAAALVAVASGIAAFRKNEGEGGFSPRTALASSVACLLLLAPPYRRADLEHLNPAVSLALVALASIAEPRGDRGYRRLRAAGAWALAAVILVTLAAPAGAHEVALPDDLVATARFVAARSAPGERIFVGNTRHDRLVYNAPLVYFLAARPNVTRYDNLHPGVVTTRPVQEEIVRSLEAAGTLWIVLWEGPPPLEPNASSVSSGVVVLDEWIARHGREKERFGPFHVLRVGEPDAPPTPVR